jgi:NADPH:quinone reductase
MRAATIRDGEIAVQEHPDPRPQTGELLVRVFAAGLNGADMIQLKGGYPAPPGAPPDIPGLELAGEVIETGDGVERFEPGDRVMSIVGGGGQAELAVVNERVAMPVPDELDWIAAGGVPEVFFTAHDALFTQAGLMCGERLLVHGAAGGVGTATIQVAKGYGARTIAVVSTEEKAEVARRAGADEAVLVEGFKDRVKELTGGRGVDIVLDVVGGDLFTDSLRCLAEQGRLLVVGFAAGQGIPEVKVNRLLLNNVDVRGVGWGAYAMTRQDFMQQQWAELVPMIESGVVRPPVGATYALEDFGRGLVEMGERRKLGKSVVRVR